MAAAAAAAAAAHDALLDRETFAFLCMVNSDLNDLNLDDSDSEPDTNGPK